MYNKINVQRHKEIRECPACRETREIWTQKQTSFHWRFCESCNTKYTNWQKKVLRMKVDTEYRKTYLQSKRKDFLQNYVKHMLHSVESRAKKKGLDFNLDESDINIPKKCPILEVPLVYGTKSNYEYSPSIDRIDNSKGYIKGNIQIISKKANSMKNSASFSELKAFVKNILRYSLNTTEQQCSDLEDKELQG